MSNSNTNISTEVNPYTDGNTYPSYDLLILFYNFVDELNGAQQRFKEGILPKENYKIVMDRLKHCIFIHAVIKERFSK